jgi:DNA-binding MarR family transcriptional regulator
VNDSPVHPSLAADSTPGDAEITLRVLNAIEDNSVVTQRSLARELGIALGLANSYLRRCTAKGLIKVAHVPARRYAYYLTPHGFAEKSRLTAQYLSQSLTFFRLAREQCQAAFAACEREGWRRVALCGNGELADIALLCRDGYEVEILGIVDPAAPTGARRKIGIVDRIAALGAVDAAIVTDTAAPQSTYDRIVLELSIERVLAPAVLHVSRRKPVFLD